MKKICIVDALCRLLATDSEKLKSMLGVDFEATARDGRPLSLTPEDAYRVLAISSIPVYSTQMNAERWIKGHEGILIISDIAHTFYFKEGLIFDVKAPLPIALEVYKAKLDFGAMSYLCLVKITPKLVKELRYVSVQDVRNNP